MTTPLRPGQKQPLTYRHPSSGRQEGKTRRAPTRAGREERARSRVTLLPMDHLPRLQVEHVTAEIVVAGIPDRACKSPAGYIFAMPATSLGYRAVLRLGAALAPSLGILS